MKEEFPILNEEGDIKTPDGVQTGLFDGMGEEEKEIAARRIGETLFDERYKDCSEENKKIFKEIEADFFSRLSELTEVHPYIAHIVADKVRLITLPHVAIMYEDSAACLGKHEGGLCLPGLRTFEYGVSKQLAKHRGFLDLSGIESMSDDDASEFSAHEGELKITGLKNISDQGLRELAKHKELVYLPEAYQKKWEEYRKEMYPVRKAV